MNIVNIINVVLAAVVIASLQTEAVSVSPFGRDVESAVVSGSGSVPLVVNDQLQFIGNISIGTPPQNITVLFDLNSTSLIVLGGSYQGSKIGAGTVPVIANVMIGGLNISNQICEITDSINGSISIGDGSIDGIFGLGYVNNMASPMSNLLSQGVLESQLFSVHWSQDLNASSGSAELMLGAIDTGVYHGQLVYVNVPDLSSWQFQLDSAWINGTSVSNSSQVVLSTSSNAIAVPDAVFDSLKQYLQIQPNENNVSYSIACDSNATLFEFIIANSSFTLNASDFMLLSRNSSNVSSGNDTAMCVFNVQNSGSAGWILGTPFLMKYYSVYDIQNKRIGLVESVKVPISPEEPTTSTSTTTTSTPTVSSTKSPGNSAMGLFAWSVYEKLMLLVVIALLLLK